MGKVLKEIKESATQILGVQHSRQREELKQSPGDRTRVGMFKEQQEKSVWPLSGKETQFVACGIYNGVFFKRF